MVLHPSVWGNLDARIMGARAHDIASKRVGKSLTELDDEAKKDTLHTGVCGNLRVKR